MMTVNNSANLPYSVGTWTPTFFGSTTAGTTSYNQQVGYYVQIGKFIFIQGYVDVASATGTGNVNIGGFPFLIKTVSLLVNEGCIAFQNGRIAYPSNETSMTFNGDIDSFLGDVICSASSELYIKLQMSNTACQYYVTLTYQSA